MYRSKLMPVRGAVKAFAWLTLLPSLYVGAETAGANSSLFQIHGSNTVGAELAPALVGRYLVGQGLPTPLIEPAKAENEKFIVSSKKGAESRVFVAAHGSSTGFKALAANKADIWASSRPVKDKEVKKFASRADLKSIDSEHVIAIDGLAVLVNTSNPIDELSKSQLSDIFSGKVKNWRQVGGLNAPINLYARDDQSGTYDTFKNLVLGKKNKLDSSAKRFESNSVLSDEVSQDPNGIGFSGYTAIGDNKALAVSDGGGAAIYPNRLTIATEDYPLSRRLFFYTSGWSNDPDISKFIEFTLSEKGQEVVGEIGFIEQNLIAVEPELDLTVPASFKRMTKDYKRLSVNFRFAEGRTKLDNKAIRDIKRVIDYLTKNGRSAKELMFIGFADKQSDEFRAQQISELRAHSVFLAFKKKGLQVKAYTGYGQYMPVAQAGGKTGASRNGRVEVWIRDRKA